MRFLSLSLLAALAQSIALSLAVPISEGRTSLSALVPRSDHCYNAPNTIAGTPLHARDLPLHPRVPPGGMIAQIWCAQGSRTYVIITWTVPIAAGAVNNLLNWAYGSILNHIHNAGDGLVQAGSYRIMMEGVELWMQNVNNHQQTWGVLSAAISALAGFQNTGPLGPMAVNFQIYDGRYLVGTGYIRGVVGG